MKRDEKRFGRVSGGSRPCADETASPCLPPRSVKRVSRRYRNAEIELPPEEIKPLRALTLPVRWTREMILLQTLPEVGTGVAECTRPKRAVLLSYGNVRVLPNSAEPNTHTAFPLVVRVLGIQWYTKRTPRRRDEGTSCKQQERRLRRRTKPLLRTRILCASLRKS